MSTRMIRVACAAAVLSCLAGVVGAQGIPAGVWKGEYEMGRRVLVGQGFGGKDSIAIRFDSTSLELRAIDDSLSGTWRVAGRTMAVHGAFRDGSLRLTTDPQKMDLRINDMAITNPITFRFEGIVAGERMTGKAWLLPYEADDAHEWRLQKAK